MLAALGLDSEAEQVYLAMLRSPDAGVADLGGSLGLPQERVRSALDQLFSLLLVRESVERPGRMRAVSPEVGLHAALARQQEDLARRQVKVAESQSAVARMLADQVKAPQDAGRDAETLTGMDAVLDRLEQFSREATCEVLTFMPGGAQSAAALRAALENDEKVLARGVAVHTIGLDSVRNDPGTLDYARFLSENGGQFRTAAVLPPRMILVDRRSALVPIDPRDTRKGALCLSAPGVIAALTALFDQVWEISTPLGADREPDREGLSPQERALLGLLSQGLTDEAAATRLGVSPRTARRMMAELMERLGARSRFEAGLRAAQHGWL